MVFSQENTYDDNNIFFKIKNSARITLEDYYNSIIVISIFIIGGFLWYMSMGISRGIFLLLDLFFIYKIARNFFEFRKLRAKDALNLGYQLKYLEKIFAFTCLVITEVIVRHFLNLNIVIGNYLMIMAFFYGAGFLIYMLLKNNNRKFYFKCIDDENYERIMSLRAIKHKWFMIISFFVLVALIFVNIIGVLSRTNTVIVMTICYVGILTAAIDLKSDIKIEYQYLESEKYFSFEEKIPLVSEEESFEDFEEEELDDEKFEEELDEVEITDVFLDNTNVFNEEYIGDTIDEDALFTKDEDF